MNAHVSREEFWLHAKSPRRESNGWEANSGVPSPQTRKLPQNACNVRVGDQNVKPKEYGRLGAGEKIQQSRFIKDFHTELLSLFELLPASSPAAT